MTLSIKDRIVTLIIMTLIIMTLTIMSLNITTEFDFYTECRDVLLLF